MLNVIVALGLKGNLWANRKIKNNCDNKAIVDLLQSGYARNGHLC